MANEKEGFRFTRRRGMRCAVVRAKKWRAKKSNALADRIAIPMSVEPHR